MTLKQLQAEWRDNKCLTSQPEVSPRTLSAFTFEHCADALTPFILQQERDAELLRELIAQAQQQNECYGVGMSNSLSKIIEQARSRLKEME